MSDTDCNKLVAMTIVIILAPERRKAVGGYYTLWPHWHFKTKYSFKERANGEKDAEDITFADGLEV